jgi:uncharacterized protein YbjT (DUF2867 family)
MQRVLVTGGTGTLGQAVVDTLVKRGYTVRVMSRQARPPHTPDVEWAQADLATGQGLAAAVAGVDTIIHAATNSPASAGPAKAPARIGAAATPAGFGRVRDAFGGGKVESVDVAGTERLLAAARRAGVGHFIYVSIVGIEHVPLAYYRHKLDAEALVRQAGVPWSIMRATQFYSLVDTVLGMLTRLPIVPLPGDFRFQPCDPRDVAAWLGQAVGAGPGGRLPDFAGPTVYTLGDLAKTWLAARGMRRRIVSVHMPGRMAAALRAGELTSDGPHRGRITWALWLGEQYGREAVQPARQPQIHGGTL